MKKKLLSLFMVIAVCATAMVSLVACDKETDTFAIYVASLANGSVTTDKAAAKAGETVTVTVVASDGYELTAGSLKMNEVAIVDNTFTMPAAEAVVSASFNAGFVPDGLNIVNIYEKLNTATNFTYTMTMDVRGDINAGTAEYKYTVDDGIVYRQERDGYDTITPFYEWKDGNTYYNYKNENPFDYSKTTSDTAGDDNNSAFSHGFLVPNPNNIEYFITNSDGYYVLNPDKVAAYAALTDNISVEEIKGLIIEIAEGSVTIRLAVEQQGLTYNYIMVYDQFGQTEVVLPEGALSASINERFQRSLEPSTGPIGFNHQLQLYTEVIYSEATLKSIVAEAANVDESKIGDIKVQHMVGMSPENASFDYTKPINEQFEITEISSFTYELLP